LGSSYANSRVLVSLFTHFASFDLLSECLGSSRSFKKDIKLTRRLEITCLGNADSESLQWQSIGEAMNIQYEGYLSKSKWADGLDFYHDISSWADQYEQKYMVPAESNKKVADELMPLLLFFVPKSAQNAAHNIVGYLMGDRLRKSMMLAFLS
jgi:hypothetical protein